MVHPKTLKIPSSITPGYTDRYALVTIEIWGGTDRYASVLIKTLVLSSGGRSAFQYPLGPVHTARTGQYISKLRTLV